MSDRRETTLNASELARSPSDEAGRLPLPEVLAHRRHHHDDRRERVRRGRLPRARGAVETAGVEDERIDGGLERVRLGQHLTELELSVPVEVRLARDERGERAPQHPLGEVVEVPRLAEHLAVRELQVEGNGARRILRRARPRVQDHVVRCERRRAGDDPLDALVQRVALHPDRLRAHEVAADRGVGRQCRRAEPVALRARVVAVRDRLELARERRQLRGVREEIGLHRSEPGGLGGGSRRSGLGREGGEGRPRRPRRGSSRLV